MCKIPHLFSVDHHNNHNNNIFEIYCMAILQRSCISTLCQTIIMACHIRRPIDDELIVHTVRFIALFCESDYIKNEVQKSLGNDTIE